MQVASLARQSLHISFHLLVFAHPLADVRIFDHLGFRTRFTQNVPRISLLEQAVSNVKGGFDFYPYILDILAYLARP